MRIEVDSGLAEAVDEVASIAAPGYRFLTRTWFQAAVAAYASEPSETIVGRRGDGRAVVAIPLVRWHARIPFATSVPGCYWPFRSFPAAADLSIDEMGALLASGEARRSLGLVWRVGPANADDPGVGLLLQAAREADWVPLSRRIATSFVLDFAQASGEGPWPRGSTLRKNRFHEKHLAGRGEIEWRFITGDAWSEEVLADLASIEARSWVARERDLAGAKFLNPRHARFWKTVATDPVIREHLWAAMLYIAGRPVAFSLDLDCGPTKYAIANSYDEALAQHSPGKVLYYRNLVVAMQRGIRRVDWGAGDGGYKSTLGALPGPEIADHLFVRRNLARGPILAALARWWFRGAAPATPPVACQPQ